MKPYIIAEIGSNWCKYEVETGKDNFSTAKIQINQAKLAGANAVKFQYFTPEELWSIEHKDKEFYKNLEKYCLPLDWIKQLHGLCSVLEIDFLCTAFSVKGYEEIDPYVKYHKVASPEACDPQIMEWILNQDKRVIISTGCLETWEVEELTLKMGIDDVLLECVSNYPAKAWQYDLRLHDSKIVTWGVSDHTLTDDLALIARRKGASYFEKHVDFCTHFGDDTPDTPVSCNRYDFAEYVKSVNSELSNYDKIKFESKTKYGRTVKIDGKYYRPAPGD